MSSNEAAAEHFIQLRDAPADFFRVVVSVVAMKARLGAWIDFKSVVGNSKWMSASQACRASELANLQLTLSTFAIGHVFKCDQAVDHRVFRVVLASRTVRE